MKRKAKYLFKKKTVREYIVVFGEYSCCVVCIVKLIRILISSITNKNIHIVKQNCKKYLKCIRLCFHIPIYVNIICHLMYGIAELIV